MKAVIMAGGEGTRLRPLTVSRPKPMVPVCNRPVMEYTLDLLRRYGIDTVIVTLHYKAEDIISYFGDGSDFGLKIHYSIEKQPLGTAGSVKQIQDLIAGDSFIVISGDGLADIDLGRAIAFHKEKNAVATLVLMRVSNPLEYGVVITDDNNAIERFLEKPTWGEVFSDQVNTGIYVLEPEVLDLMEKDREYDFSKEIFPQLLEKKAGLYGYVASGYWCDIGDIEHYASSHRDMFGGKVLQEMAGAQRAPGVWIGEGTKIDPSAVLEPPLMIGRNCRIGAHAYISSYTCIGDNCIVEEGVSLLRNIVFSNVFIGRQTDSTGAIICRQCTIESGVTLCDGCVIGENVFIGRGATIKYQVSIWPDKHIPDGSIISENLVWGRKNSETIFGCDAIVGLANLEITPEFAMKLGASFGGTLPKGSTVMVSRDASPVSRLANRALICGLNSVGVNVLDLHYICSAVSRYIAKKNDAVGGGIHSRIFRDDAREIELSFFDGMGINIEKTRQRKLENTFVRQDFRRTDIDEVGLISYMEDAAEVYIEDFMRHFDVDAIKKANFKVVVDYSYGRACKILPFILSRLGVETVSINAYVDPEKAREVQEKKGQALKQLADIVKPVGASLGFMIDPDAERFYLIDEQGGLIRSTNLLALMAMMVFKKNQDALVAVPVSVPGIMEKLAAPLHGRIIRTKTDHRSIMYSAAVGRGRIAMAGTASGAFIFPQFSPGFDAMFSLAQLLEMMAFNKMPLSEMKKQIPPHFSISGRVECSWSLKAKVMRLLVERYREERLELLDGVRIDFKDDSSVLMVPHPSLACINVWADASTKERAEAIMQRAHLIIPKLAELDDDSVRRSASGASAVKANETIPEERAFHFWIPGRYLGIQARSLHTFTDVLHYVEPASLEYHMERGDFSKWIETEMGRKLMAIRIEEVAKAHYKGEELRRRLLDCFGEAGRNVLAASSDDDAIPEPEPTFAVNVIGGDEAGDPDDDAALFNAIKQGGREFTADGRRGGVNLNVSPKEQDSGM